MKQISQVGSFVAILKPGILDFLQMGRLRSTNPLNLSFFLLGQLLEVGF